MIVKKEGQLGKPELPLQSLPSAKQARGSERWWTGVRQLSWYLLQARCSCKDEAHVPVDELRHNCHCADSTQELML